MALFIATFTTLLAIINPFEALPVYLGFIEGKDEQTRVNLAWRACLYALVLMFFFLIFGALLLKIFGVPLSMVRIAGGIILAQLGFTLFNKPSQIIEQAIPKAGAAGPGDDVAFVPLAMPIMFGPGAMATILGMTPQLHHSSSELAGFAEISAALVATMACTLVMLLMAKQISRRLGARGIDAATRIVGFFVSAMGIGMAFAGAMEALHTYGVTMPR